MSASRASESANRRIEFAREYLEGLKKCLEALSLDQVAEVIGYLEETYRNGKQVFIIGNGGSAATASHMACDLGKTVLGKQPEAAGKRFRVMALTDNVPLITAWANDVGYDCVFAEQLRNVLEAGDLVVAISGSGNSRNIVEAVRVAKELGAKTIALLGFCGGQTGDLVDKSVIVPSYDYGYIEDIHLVLEHMITSYFTKAFLTG